MPEPDQFPKSHVVTFKYYVGVIHFLDEDYEQAQQNLTEALNSCHRNAMRNKALILTYLVPTRMLTTRSLPSRKLLKPYPRLSTLFLPLVSAIRSGSLSAFDQALAAGEVSFVKRRIYLTLERGRDICLRNLLRQVYLAAGTDEQGARRTRIRVDEFGAAIRLGETKGVDGDTVMSDGDSRGIEGDEVECLLANMIYKVRSPMILSIAINLSVSDNLRTTLTFLPEPNERLHLPRPRHRRPLQSRCLPRHCRINPHRPSSHPHRHRPDPGQMPLHHPIHPSVHNRTLQPNHPGQQSHPPHPKKSLPAEATSQHTIPAYRSASLIARIVTHQTLPHLSIPLLRLSKSSLSRSIHQSDSTPASRL